MANAETSNNTQTIGPPFFNNCQAVFASVAGTAARTKKSMPRYSRRGTLGSRLLLKSSLAKRLAKRGDHSAMHQRLLCVRRKIAPSEAARVELEYSPTELVASNSNFGPARNTFVSPD